MNLQPAELLGLPVLDAKLNVVALRYVLLVLAAAWGWLAYRGRAWAALAVGGVFVSLAVGFWILCLGRPYGLFLDEPATRWAAQASVVIATGAAGEGFVSGEPASAVWRLLPALGLSLRTLLAARLLAPIVGLVGIAIAIQALWAPRTERMVAVLLWLAFSTGDLDTLRGFGLLDRAWSRPGSCLALVGIVALVLAVSRLAERVRPAGSGALLLACAWLVMPAHGLVARWWEYGLLLSFDQVPWIVLAFLGLRRHRDVACRAFIVGGGLTVLAAGFGFPVDAWGGQALYRLGLLLAAAPVVRELAVVVAQRLAESRRWQRLNPQGLGVGLLILALAPSSFVAWWDPPRLDPVASASLEPLSTNLTGVMEWIRHQTPAELVFVASDDYAPVVAVLGGRRVLQAPGLVRVGDRERRIRAERLALSGRDSGSLAARYGLGYVFAAPGDYREHGVDHPSELEARGLELLHSGPGELRVYAIPR